MLTNVVFGPHVIHIYHSTNFLTANILYKVNVLMDMHFHAHH